MGLVAIKQREAVIGLLVGVLLVAVAVAGVVSSAHAREDRARATAESELASAVGSIQGDFANVVDDARRLAAQVTARGVFVPALATTTGAAASGVSFARASGSSFAVEGAIDVSGADLEPARGVLEAARDSDEPLAVPAVGPAGRLVVAAPSFVPLPAGAPSIQTTTDDRRARLLGYTLVGVDVGTLTSRAARDGTLVTFRAQGATSDATSRDAAGRAATTMTMAGGPFVVATAIGGVATVTGAEAALLLLALVVGAGIWAMGIAVARRRLASEAAIESALDQLHLLSSLVPLVQDSLDLGRVLPEIASRLHDELDLIGIGFATPTTDGGFRDVYVLGSVDDVEPVASAGRSLAAGESAAIVMHRGGRTVGLLRVKPRRELSGDELDTLHGATELATAAIVSGQLFEQQDQALRNLRELDELKTAFLGTASHELRTPVTAINGFAKLLDESWENGTPDELRLYASRIRANAAVLDSLVQDLLDFARLERGRRLVVPTGIDLAAATAQVLDRLSVLFARHLMATDFAPTGPVLADGEALERILTNLVSNAVRYSPQGSTVTVHTARRDGGAELIVDDEGPGVPPEERSRVFVRFFRGAGDSIVRTRGTGIGLSIVKEYVDQLGGTISVETAPGGGARFRVWLAGAPNDEGARDDQHADAIP